MANELSRILSPLSATKIYSINQLLEGKDTRLVTVCGFEFRDGQYGVKPVFRIKEQGGAKFWGAGALIEQKLVPLLMDKFGSAEKIDEQFAADPQVWKLSKPIPLKNGHQFRPLEFLGSADGFASNVEECCTVAAALDHMVRVP